MEISLRTSSWSSFVVNFLFAMALHAYSLPVFLSLILRRPELAFAQFFVENVRVVDVRRRSTEDGAFLRLTERPIGVDLHRFLWWFVGRRRNKKVSSHGSSAKAHEKEERERERERESTNWTRSGNQSDSNRRHFYNSRRRQKKVAKKTIDDDVCNARARATKKTTAPRTSPFAVDAAHPIFIYATMRVVRIIMHAFPNVQPLFLTTPSSFTDFFYLGFWACVCLFVLWVSLDFFFITHF